MGAHGRRPWWGSRRGAPMVVRCRRRGRGERIRTSDSLHPKQVRYQAALHPVTPFRALVPYRERSGTARLSRRDDGSDDVVATQVGEEARGERAHGAGAVGLLALGADAELGERRAEVGHVEERIVAEAAGA